MLLEKQKSLLLLNFLSDSEISVCIVLCLPILTNTTREQILNLLEDSLKEKVAFSSSDVIQIYAAAMTSKKSGLRATIKAFQDSCKAASLHYLKRRTNSKAIISWITYKLCIPIRCYKTGKLYQVKDTQFKTLRGDALSTISSSPYWSKIAVKRQYFELSVWTQKLSLFISGKQFNEAIA